MRVLAVLLCFLASFAYGQRTVSVDANGVLRYPTNLPTANDLARTTAVDASNQVHAARLSAVEGTNAVQNARLTATEATNVAQDRLIGASVSTNDTLYQALVSNITASGATVYKSNHTFHLVVAAQTGTAASVQADLDDHKTNAASHAELLDGKYDASNPSNYITEATSLGMTNVTGGILQLIGRRASLVATNLTAVLDSIYAALTHGHSYTAVTNAPWVETSSLGTAAYSNSAAFATAAQGDKADASIATNHQGAVALGGPMQIGTHLSYTNMPATSVVLGGQLNLATGTHAVAMGKMAQARHDNTFVFGDGTGWTTSSTNKEMVVRMENGFRFLGGALSGDGSALTNVTAEQVGAATPAMATSAAQAVVAPWTNQVTGAAIAAAGGVTSVTVNGQAATVSGGAASLVMAAVTPTTLSFVNGTGTVDGTAFFWDMGSPTQNVTIVLGGEMTNAAKMRGFWLGWSNTAFSITFPTATFTNTGSAFTTNRAYSSYWHAGKYQTLFQGGGK